MYSFIKLDDEAKVIAQAKALVSMLQKSGEAKYSREVEFLLKKMIEAVLGLMRTEGYFNNYSNSSEYQKILVGSFISHLFDFYEIKSDRYFSDTNKLDEDFAKLSIDFLNEKMIIEKWEMFKKLTESGCPDGFRCAVYELCDILGW